MDIRSMLSLTGGLLVLGLAGYWWGGFGHSAAPLSPRDDSLLPDYEISGIHALRTDENGAVNQILTADRLRHFAKPDQSRVDQPRLVMYRDGEPRWDVAAQTATGRDAERELTLSGQVNGHSLGPNPLVFETEWLQADRDSRILSTASPVRLHNAQGEIRSLGLTANIAAGTLEFPAQVRGSYVIPHKR